MVSRPAARGPAQRGIGLIEMMVVLALMLLLGLAAAPFTAAWSQQASVSQTHAMLQQAHAQLKALALRNPSAVSAERPAAVLVSLPGQLCVVPGTPAALDCSASTWRAAPTASVTWGSTQQPGACLAMASSGLLLSSALGCTLAPSFRIARGTEGFDGSL